MDGIGSPADDASTRPDDEQRVLPDDWPTTADGSVWDGTGLLALTLTRRGESPFAAAWDVDSFIGEVSQMLQAKVVDIPLVRRGANHYGLHMQLDNRPDVVARLSRHDVNAPGFHGSSLEVAQRQLSRFELATYDALQPLGGPFGRRPLHHRDPVAWPPPSPPLPLDGATCRSLVGRRLFVFEKAPGEGYDYIHWRALDAAQKSALLAQSAKVAATLFHYRLPGEYASTWLPMRMAEQQRIHVCAQTMAPTRDFCAALLHARIESTLERVAVGSPRMAAVASAAREALDWLVPRVLPRASKQLDEAALYRFVLDHGDFGMHNMTIAEDERGSPYITSVYDWEAASIVPAVLSEPKMVVTADLVLNDRGKPSIRRWGDGDSPARMAEY